MRLTCGNHALRCPRGAWESARGGSSQGPGNQGERTFQVGTEADRDGQGSSALTSCAAPDQARTAEAPGRRRSRCRASVSVFATSQLIRKR